MNIIIAGANSKIGRIMVPEFQENHQLSINSREKGLYSQSKVLKNSLDLSKNKGFEALLKRSFDYFGKIDAVINLAGYLSKKELADFNKKEFCLEMETNIYIYYLLMRSLMKYQHLVSKPAVIINFTISDPEFLYKKITMHSISKAGLERLSRTFNEICGPDGITTICIRLPDMQKEKWALTRLCRILSSLLENRKDIQSLPYIIELSSLMS